MPQTILSAVFHLDADTVCEVSALILRDFLLADARSTHCFLNPRKDVIWKVRLCNSATNAVHRLPDFYLNENAYNCCRLCFDRTAAVAVSSSGYRHQAVVQMA